jgi:hypothetical protein
VRALAANQRDLCLVDLFETQHVALDHRDTSRVAVLRCTAMADGAFGMTDSAEPRAWHALSSFLPPPRESCVDNSTRTFGSPFL